MTYRIGPTSPNAAAAAKLGALLVRLMDERGVSRRGLARHIGVNRTTLQWWCYGEALPRLEVAERLAEALADDRILEIVKGARVGTCRCGATFVYDSGRHRRYCSRRCRSVEQKVRDGILPKRTTIARHLEEHRDAIASFCAACELDGICRTPDCPLRPVSPLPLVVSTAVDVAPAWAQGKRDPAEASATTKAQWDRLTPEQRSQRSAKAAAARWPEKVPA